MARSKTKSSKLKAWIIALCCLIVGAGSAIGITKVVENYNDQPPAAEQPAEDETETPSDESEAGIADNMLADYAA